MEEKNQMTRILEFIQSISLSDKAGNGEVKVFDMAKNLISGYIAGLNDEAVYDPWHPIAELPSRTMGVGEDIPVILRFNDGEVMRAVYSFPRKEFGWYETEGINHMWGTYKEDVTHWMPYIMPRD